MICLPNIHKCLKNDLLGMKRCVVLLLMSFVCSTASLSFAESPLEYSVPDFIMDNSGYYMSVNLGYGLTGDPAAEVISYQSAAAGATPTPDQLSIANIAIKPSIKGAHGAATSLHLGYTTNDLFSIELGGFYQPSLEYSRSCDANKQYSMSSFGMEMNASWAIDLQNIRPYFKLGGGFGSYSLNATDATKPANGKCTSDYGATTTIARNPESYGYEPVAFADVLQQYTTGDTAGQACRAENGGDELYCMAGVAGNTQKDNVPPAKKMKPAIEYADAPQNTALTGDDLKFQKRNSKAQNEH